MLDENHSTSSASGRIVAKSVRGPRLYETTAPARRYLRKVRELVGEQPGRGTAAN